MNEEKDMEMTLQNMLALLKMILVAVVVPGGLVVLGALWVYKKKRSLEDKISELNSALATRGDIDKSKESTNEFNKAVDQYEHDRDAILKSIGGGDDTTKPKT